MLCPLCDFSNASKQAFKAHLEEHELEEGGKLSCMLCDYEATSKDKFYLHTVRHTKDGMYACNRCDYSTSRKQYLEAHMNRHAEGHEYFCKQCPFVTVIKREFVRHMSTHNLPKEEEKAKPVLTPPPPLLSQFPSSLNIFNVLNNENNGGDAPQKDSFTALVQNMISIINAAESK